MSDESVVGSFLDMGNERVFVSNAYELPFDAGNRGAPAIITPSYPEIIFSCPYCNAHCRFWPKADGETHDLECLLCNLPLLTVSVKITGGER